jgi:hypothetical protein
VEFILKAAKITTHAATKAYNKYHIPYLSDMGGPQPHKDSIHELRGPLYALRIGYVKAIVYEIKKPMFMGDLVATDPLGQRLHIFKLAEDAAEHIFASMIAMLGFTHYHCDTEDPRGAANEMARDEAIGCQSAGELLKEAGRCC